MTAEVKGKTSQKKKYSPPRLSVLTTDQAMSRLMEKAFPGEDTTQQLLREASQMGPGTSGEQPSIAEDSTLARARKSA